MWTRSEGARAQQSTREGGGKGLGCSLAGECPRWVPAYLMLPSSGVMWDAHGSAATELEQRNALSFLCTYAINLDARNLELVAVLWLLIGQMLLFTEEARQWACACPVLQQTQSMSQLALAFLSWVVLFFSCGYRVNPGSGEGGTYDPGHHNPQYWELKKQLRLALLSSFPLHTVFPVILLGPVGMQK